MYRLKLRMRLVLSGKIASPESVVSGLLRRLRRRAGLGARRQVRCSIRIFKCYSVLVGPEKVLKACLSEKAVSGFFSIDYLS
jgi:hypothetical protein